MFKNYLKVTLRNMKRQKGYTLINLAGLSVGIACVVLIILVVQYEFNYESHHKNAHRIYRINVEHKRANQVYRVTSSPVPLAETLNKELPEVTHFTRFVSFSQSLVAHEDQQFYENGLAFVDPGILEMFNFPLLAGNKANVRIRTKINIPHINFVSDNILNFVDLFILIFVFGNVSRWKLG